MVGHHVQVASAGSAPSQVHPLAVRILQERGIDISQQHSKNVNEFANDHFDYAITLCAEEVCPVFLSAGSRLHWGMPDPSTVAGDLDARLNAFRATADEIEMRLREFIKEIGIQPQP
jgi:protein-tyrosine-phosphatase